MDDFREWLSDNLRYILLGLIVLVVLALLFLGIRLISASLSESDDGGQTQQESQTDIEETDEETDAEDTDEDTSEESDVTEAQETVTLEKEAWPEVSSVIQTYYTALGSKDIDGIKSVVDTLDATEEAKITKDTYIESYGSVETYTVDGPEDGTYVVYASYTYRFNDIDTDVPGLSQLYVCTDEDGSLYIATGELDEDTQAYIEETMELEDVAALIEEVEEAYTEALESDEELAEFVAGLGVETTDAASAEVGDTITVKYGCNVRSEPSEEAEIIGKLAEGTQVTKEGVSDNWIMITYEGETGYVRSDLFE